MRKRHILLALCGISPAVITETVFQLMKNGDPPDRVIVITTVAGEHALKNELFISGVWNQLLKNMKLDIAFVPNQDHIRLLPDTEGNAFDIVSPHSIDSMADFILGILRQFTENPDVRITFSIAGGRKSMSAVSALCMSLLGRSDDQLCHVLVTPPFDDPLLNPRFYFPCPGQTHTTREGRTIQSTEAKLALSRIPFVRCRYLIENELNRISGDYSLMVKLASHNAERFNAGDILEMNPGKLSIRIGQSEVKLHLKEFLLYWMLAERRQNGQDCLRGTMELYEEFIDFMAKDNIRKSLPRKVTCQYDSLLSGINMNTFFKRVSDLCSVLKKSGAPECFLPTRGKGVYGLGLSPDRIQIRTSAGHPKS